LKLDALVCPVSASVALKHG